MDEKLINEFLLESIIPGFRKTLNKDARTIIELVVLKAHRDTMIGARYKQTDGCKQYCYHNDHYRKTLIEMIEESECNISGRELLKNLYEGSNNMYGVNIGLIQKLVNMSVKYLYVIEACGLFEKRPFYIHINKIECDCPLDSRIIDDLNLNREERYSAWTKMVDYDEYFRIQDDIKEKGYACRLQYDLEKWGL